jgi:hypothetical protein
LESRKSTWDFKVTLVLVPKVILEVAVDRRLVSAVIASTPATGSRTQAMKIVLPHRYQFGQVLVGLSRRVPFGPDQEGAECFLFFLHRKVLFLVFRGSQERKPRRAGGFAPNDLPTNSPDEPSL